MAQECNLIKKPLGLGNCPTMPGYFRSMFTTPNSFKIPAATIAQGNAAVLAYLQSAILAGQASRIYKWPQFFNNTPEPEDTVYQATPLGKRKVRDGFYEWLVNFSDSMCSHKAMYTHRATTGRVIFLDTDGQLVGTQNEAGDFFGFSIMMLNTEKMTPNTGDEVAMSPVRIVLNDNLELDRDGALLAVASIGTLIPLTEAAIEIVEADDAEITLNVTIACDGTPLLGLVQADFVYYDADGNEIALTGVTDNGNGSYTIEGAFETGTVNLVAPDELTVEAYESFEVDVTIAS
jgi:hypothetical protein